MAARERLSTTQVAAFAKSKPEARKKRKLFDGAGLFLTHTQVGTPVWRLRYRFGGRDRLFAIGQYPEIPLAEARAQRDWARAKLRENLDPVQARQLERAEANAASGETFELVARSWFAKNTPTWSTDHAKRIEQAFARDIFPRMGRLPVGRITPAVIAHTIESVLARGADGASRRETASKLLMHVNAVFRLACARGLRADNPAAAVGEVIPPRPTVKPRAALLTLDGLRTVLRDFDALEGVTDAVKRCHRLIAHTAVRIANAVEARWTEFDLEAEPPTWTIPRAKMKAKKKGHDHVVILSRSIAAQLRAWKAETGGKGFLFPSTGKRGHLTRESLEKQFRKLDNGHSPHGWRAAFSTLAKDHGFSRDVVELALDHLHDDAVVRAYDRGERRAERLKLAQWWDEQLNPPPADGVLPLKKKRRA